MSFRCSFPYFSKVFAMVFIYLLKTLFFRIEAFFRRWYVGGFFVVYEYVRASIKKSEEFFAVRISAHFLLKPLYQEYSIVGYGMGFITRLGRIVVGSIWYAVLILGATLVYVCWATIPLYIIYALFYGKSF